MIICKKVKKEGVAPPFFILRVEYKKENIDYNYQNHRLTDRE